MIVKHSEHFRRAWLSLTVGLLAILVVAGPVHAQDGQADGSEAFLATVSEARDAAQSRIDEANEATGVGCEIISQEACLQRFVAVELTTVAAELRAYADLLSGLDVPDAYAADAGMQVTALREEADSLEGPIAAASAGDGVALGEYGQRGVDAFIEFTSQLDPVWARAAILNPFGIDVDVVETFGDLTADERAYLVGVREAQSAAASNFDCFGRAISQSYGTTDALLGALYDCGAGKALPAIEAAASLLEPPERFVEEHAWWLAGLAENSRVDRLIGEAAVEGDVVKFLANNARAGLTLRPTPGLEPAFLLETSGAAPLDLADPLASSAYGRALFAALVDYAIVNPMGRALGAVISFPQVPRDVALEAVTELAVELRAYEAEVFAAIEELQPPPELAADHAAIVGFFSLSREGMEDLIEAAATSDVDATFAIEEAADAAYCAATESLSDAISSMSVAFFDPDRPDCR